MKPLSRIFKNRIGITLIEVIIALAISTVVLMITFSIFNFGNNVFRKGNEQYDIQSDVRIVADYIQDQVRYATSLQLVTSIPPEKRGDLDDDDIANDTFGLEYIVLNNNRLMHYVIDDNVDSDGNLLDSDKFRDKYTFPNTLPGTSFDSSSANELIFVVNASDRPGNYALRSFINLPNYSIHEGLYIEKYGAEDEEVIGIRFTRDPRMLASLGGGEEIVDSDFIQTEIVGVGNNDNQKKKAVRLTFSNSIDSFIISDPLVAEIKDAVAIEIRHKTNNDLPPTFNFEVTDTKNNTLKITVERNGFIYSCTVQ